MIIKLVMMVAVPCLFLVIGNAVFGRMFDREMERRSEDD